MRFGNKFNLMNRIIAILLTVQMVWSMMPATALAGQGKGLEKTVHSKTAGSPYKPVDPAPAGRYAITLEPKGKGLADFYSLDVIVVDASGKRYNEDFYTVVDDLSVDPFDALRRHTLVFEDVPATISIRCKYKYNYPGYDYEELIYDADFKEGVGQSAIAVSKVNDPGTSIWFCDYSVEYLEGPLRYIDENGEL